MRNHSRSPLPSPAVPRRAPGRLGTLLVVATTLGFCRRERDMLYGPVRSRVLGSLSFGPLDCWEQWFRTSNGTA